MIGRLKDFKIADLPGIGKLARPGSRRNSGRCAPGPDKYDKQDARDSSLWKANKEGEPTWDTGAGRPAAGKSMSAMPGDSWVTARSISWRRHRPESSHTDRDSEGTKARTGAIIAVRLPVEFLNFDHDKMSKSLECLQGRTFPIAPGGVGLRMLSRCPSANTHVRFDIMAQAIGAAAHSNSGAGGAVKGRRARRPAAARAAAGESAAGSPPNVPAGRAVLRTAARMKAALDQEGESARANPRVLIPGLRGATSFARHAL